MEQREREMPEADGKKVKLDIQGMHCASCALLIEKALKDHPGVKEANVNFATEKAYVAYNPNLTKKAELVEKIRSTGYDAHIETKKTIINIGGMTCASCAPTIETALRKTGGIMEANVNLATEKAVVVYDSHIHPQDRTFLWLKILKQLLNRKKFVHNCIGLLYHEASVLFPERSREQKWHDVQEYSQHFVECRKALIRHIIVSQIEYEIESSIRMKCAWQILRKGRAGKHHHPEVKASTPFLRIDEYNLVLSSGGFKKYNDVKKFHEKKTIMKMIPTMTTYVTRDSTNQIQEKNHTKRIIIKHDTVFEQITNELGIIVSNRKIGDVRVNTSN